jgi:hypothetical protein
MSTAEREGGDGKDNRQQLASYSANLNGDDALEMKLSSKAEERGSAVGLGPGQNP